MIKRDKLKICLISAALSLACYVAAFSLNDVGLFGSKSVLISDMGTQFIQFFTALRSGRLSAFTPYLGMGMGFIGNIAYYLSSPLSLLVFLFPETEIERAVFVIGAVKSALAAASFALLLLYERPQKRFAVVPFAVLYSLMSYVFFFFINLFWLDALIWLPIIAIGLIRLTDDNRAGLLTASLAALFFSNFYISYMAGLFAALFLIYLCVSRSLGFKETLHKLMRLVGSALAAACFSAVLLLPTFSDILKRIPSESAIEYGRFNFTLKMLINKLCVGGFDSIGNAAAPTVFCGCAVLLLAVCFLFCKGIKPRERLCGFGLLVFMLAGSVVPAFDFVWHAFSIPNSFAYRYAFAISFLTVYLAFRAFCGIESAPKKLFWAFLAVPAGFILLFAKLDNFLKPQVIIASAVFYAAFAALLLLGRYGRLKSSAALLLAVLLVCAEATANGALILKGVDEQNSFPEYAATDKYEDDMNSLLALTDGGFYRTEFERNPYCDEGIRFGYYGISLFSSCFDRAMSLTFDALGYEGYYIYRAYLSGDAFRDSFFGLRYVISPRDIDYLEQIGEAGDYKLYKNDDALPIGFTSQREILNLTFDGSADENLDALAKALAGTSDRQAALKTLRSRGFETSEFSKNGIRGSIDMPADGVLLFTVPFDRGLRAVVDGQSAPIVRAANAFAALELEAGRHEVVITYFPTALYIGAAVSAASLLTAFVMLKRKRTSSL